MGKSKRQVGAKKSRGLLLAWAALLLPCWAQGQSASPAEAMRLEQQGKLEEAAQAWRAVIQQNPNDAGAFASLGVVLSREQKYPEAAKAYRKALALNPNLPGVPLNLGLAEFKQGQFAAAIPPLHAALEADPQSMQVITLLGLSCYGAKEFTEASKYLALAASSDPGNAESHESGAELPAGKEISMRAGRVQEASATEPEFFCRSYFHWRSLGWRGQDGRSHHRVPGGGKACSPRT